MTVLGKEFIFIVGAPRSGTSWLHRMLLAHPSVAGIEGELTLFSRYLAPVEGFYRKETEAIEAGKWSQGLPLLWDADRFRRHQVQFLEETYGEMLHRTPGATHVLDKHPNYANHMALIQRYVPQARFIHILRDGRDVALSMMSVRRRVGHSPGEVREAAREWKRHVVNARNGGAIAHGRFLEVRYEDLRAKGADLLRDVFAFCGLQADDALVHRIVADHDIRVKPVSRGDAAGGAEGGWRERMGLRERYLFDRIAGDLLYSSGHAAPGWWALRPADRMLMAVAGPVVRLRRALHMFMQALKAPLASHLELIRK